MDIALQLLLQLVLILLNAFFAATEIAVISLNEKKLKAQAEDGDKKAVQMLKIVEDPTRFLSTIQVGITLAGFLGSALAADNFADRLAAFVIKTIPAWQSAHGLIQTLSVIVITLVLSYFTLVLGELVPKRLAMKHKEKLAGAVCGVISFLTVVLMPVIGFLSVSTNVVLRLFGVNPHEKEEKVSEEDIVIMLDAGVDEGTFKDDDIEYIKNVFKLDRLTAADIMTQRSALIAVSESATDDELLELIEREGYSRMPVFSESIDNIVGVLHARDYLINRAKDEKNFEDAVFEPTFIPESKPVDTLFQEMQENHTHMVIVVNEYGFVSGIVTMEDILEELVGEIWDEKDEAIEAITQTKDGSYTVLPSVSIEEFFAYFELDPDEDIQSITVNGWLTEHFGNIPEVGDSFDYHGLTIEVSQADEMMAQELTVTLREEEAAEEADQENE
ncbi:MAG: HlyC/CorC family transporter [Clostridia bacterium]|nr:HlyC/CorC family transporter [Clostridia bacterium]